MRIENMNSENIIEESKGEVIVVKNDFRLPETNIIIEAGEKIRILSKSMNEITLDQHVRARYEELTSIEGESPDAAVATLVDEIPIPYDVLVPMLTKWGYFVGPMDRR